METGIRSHFEDAVLFGKVEIIPFEGVTFRLDKSVDEMTDVYCVHVYYHRNAPSTVWCNRVIEGGCAGYDLSEDDPLAIMAIDKVNRL